MTHAHEKSVNNTTKDALPQAVNVHSLCTKVDLIKYLHLASWSPVMNTWINAIDKGFFATFPGLDAQTVRKHLPKSVPTAKGHMKKIRKKCTKHQNSTNFNHRQRTRNDRVGFFHGTQLLNKPCDVQGNLNYSTFQHHCH